MRADAALDRFKVKLDQSESSINEAMKQFSNYPKQDIKWVGWVDRTSDGAFTVRCGENKARDGAVFIVIPEDDSYSNAVVKDLGVMSNGILRLPANTVNSNFKHRFGRPVFLKAEQPKE